MKIFIASDHRGVELKKKIIDFLNFNAILPIDLGTDTTESCDYVDYANKLCTKVLREKGNCGILICATGTGMAIAANRHKGIRAVQGHSIKEVRLSRNHNDSNVLCIGSEFTSADKATALVTALITGKFHGGRHEVRVTKLDN